MNLVKQPAGTSLCGQCVVAMLVGKPLDEVVALMGDGRSYPANVKKAARHFGVSIPSRSKPGSAIAPDGNGAAMIWGKKQHWVAWSSGKWFDPASDEPLLSLDKYGEAVIATYPAEAVA